MPEEKCKRKYTHGGNLRELAAKTNLSEHEIVDFSASINPLGPPAYLRATISANLSSLIHYPDPDYQSFINAIAENVSVSVNNVVAGNGSTEIIFALPRSLPVDRVVNLGPSYIGYQEAMESAGVAVETLLLDQACDFAINWSELAASVRGRCMVFLGQPNNPTGKLFDLDELLKAARKFENCYFVVDEAFIDFVPKHDSAIRLILAGFSNIIVLRSMTKFYAIPGLRVGYAVAVPEIVLKLQKNMPPWSVNSLALALGEKFVGDHQYIQQTQQKVNSLRLTLSEQLGMVTGLKVYEGVANYLLLKVQKSGTSATDVAEKLLQKGIAVRVCGNFKGLDNSYIRVAVKAEDDNGLLVGALVEILGGTRKKSLKKTTPSIMFQGTCSDAGKSVLTAALCRILLQDGIRVAPFKSQNMSLNSFVTMDGKEMGRAQVVQAQAARLDPDVRMNPVLLKPSSEVGSQVIVNGKPVGNMSVDQYVVYKPEAFKAAKKAYDSLAEEYDAVVLEGAGSPAEVNLKGHDIVNMRMAEYARSRVILVGDIDRGGVFASFVGTMEVLAEWERKIVAGFLVNRFRGQESLLGGAFDYLKMHTNLPVLGVIPYLANLGLPEEDSVSFKKGLYSQPRPIDDHVEVALIDLPHISNFTDVEPFLAEPDVHLTVVKSVKDLGAPAAIILPGSKNVIRDLAYLQQSGLAAAITCLADSGQTEIVGICGGFQILGNEIADPYNIEASGSRAGLGLLRVSTVLEKDKTLRRKTVVHAASGKEIMGYEIHHGYTGSEGKPLFHKLDGTPAEVGAGNGLVWGTYLHGLFDADSFRHWFIDSLRSRIGLKAYKKNRPVYDLEPAFDRLAAMVRSRLDMQKIYQTMGL